ncbi:hypothetical protein [Gemmatimonas sp.]|jgi:hypothetical protein
MSEAMENSAMLISMASLFHVAFAVLCALTTLGELRVDAFFQGVSVVETR